MIRPLLDIAWPPGFFVAHAVVRGAWEYAAGGLAGMVAVSLRAAVLTE
jgi:hypothetical protein